jgi:hypothetical protein
VAPTVVHMSSVVAIARALALAFVCAFVACGQASSRDLALQAALAGIDHGRAAWAARKQVCAEYNYDRVPDPNTPSADSRGLTAVQIADDAPVWRSFVGSSLFDGGPTGEIWVETGPEVGSHANGFPAATVEALYDECEALFGHAQANVYRIVVEEGVPHTCTWDFGTCADSTCFADAIDLARFSCGSLDPAHVAPGSPPDAGAP